VREEETLASVSAAVSIPYNPAMTTLELAELQPQPSTPPESWRALPARRFDLRAQVTP
jgi:hypothetical protein